MKLKLRKKLNKAHKNTLNLMAINIKICHLLHLKILILQYAKMSRIFNWEINIFKWKIDKFLRFSKIL